VTTRAYDSVTHWLSSVQSGPGGGAALQNQSFLYDEVGNVTQRQDNNLGLSENFYYDGDNRLSYSTLNSTQNLSLNYNEMGNITSRSDIAGGANWTYSSSHVHEVTQAGSTAYQYAYDANGNMTSRQGSSITWSSYNYPTGIADSATGESVSFKYNPDRTAWYEQTNGPQGLEQLYNVGGLYNVVQSGGVTDYRNYVYAGSEPVAIISRKNNGVNTIYYFLTDHQGSVTAITNSTGGLVVNESFAAYGSRRNPSTWSGAPSSSDLTTIAGISRHGYTFQEALASMGLNEMIGRVQDAVTGRFLSADPNIPDPTNPQDYNRYSYTNNNPLTLIDPTGFDSRTACTGSMIQSCNGKFFNMQGIGVTVNNNGAGEKFFGWGYPIVCDGNTCWVVSSDLDGNASDSSQNNDPGVAPQQSNPKQCHNGSSLGNALIRYGRDTATFGGATAAVGGGIIAVGAVGTATVVFAPEGVAAMGTGAVVADAGGTITYVGLGMQAVGGVLNAARGNYGSLVSAGVQTAAAGIDALVGHFFPNLPDVLGPYNPVDAAADSASDRLGGGETCP
jgi:RHS repeat-associated protein